MPKAMIEIEAFPGINPEGVYASVYIGDAGEPSLEVLECWENILETEVDYHTVPNKDRPLIVSGHSDGVADLMDTVDMLRNLADRLEDKIKERPIFLREKWLETVNEQTGSGEPAEKFYVTYEEYLSHVLGYDGV